MLSILLTCLIAAPAQQSTPELCIEVAPPVGWVANQMPSEVRERFIEMDLSLLQAASLVPDAKRTIINLFDDVRPVAVFESQSKGTNGAWIWTARLEGDDDGDFVLVSTNGSVAATLRWQDKLYKIDGTHLGGHVAWESDQTAYPECATGLAQSVHSHKSERGSKNSSVPTAGNPDIDVMVVYTAAARAAQGGTNAMNSLINLAVTETNQAYSASQVDQELILVHSAELSNYTSSSDFGTELGRLKSTNDGKMDEVHDWREQYGADLVCEIVSGSQYCGIAYLMTNVSHSFRSSAFSVVARSCATGYYSFGHELGHNMGSTHDRGNAGSGAYSYSFGFRTSNNRYRTIMAYSPGTRIKKFSNPYVTHSGYAMGAVNSEENWRSLNNAASTVAGWYDSAGGGGERYTVTNLISGGTATLTATECTLLSDVVFCYSLTGPGPTNTAYGQLLMSSPIQHMPPVDVFGDTATTQAPVPPGLSGVTVWTQAIELGYWGTSEVTNGIEITIQ